MRYVAILLALAGLSAYASRNFVASSSQYAALMSAPITNYPATFATWFNANSTNAAGTIMVVQDRTDTARFALFSLAGGGFQIGVTPTNGGLSFNAVGVGGNPSNTWLHVCAVFASATSRSLYVNGAFVTNDTQTATVGPSVVFNATHIGTRSLSGTLGTFLDGQIADACIWNVALSTSQIASLAAGVDPRRVSSAAPVFYVPFRAATTTEVNYCGPVVSMTNSPAVGSSNPKLYKATRSGQ